jgi:hypothetical protein
VIVVQVHHAIGKLPGSPISDYAWETLHLGAQTETFSDPTDPQAAALAARLLTRPDIIGVRLVYQPDAATAGGVAVGVPSVSKPGAVLAQFGQ